MIDKEKYPILSKIEQMVFDYNIHSIKIKELQMTQEHFNLLKQEAEQLTPYKCQENEYSMVFGVKITIKENEVIIPC